MKRTLTIVLAALALSSTLTYVWARQRNVDPLPPLDDRVLRSVRAIGLEPASYPVRRGNYITLRAFDAAGAGQSVVADGQSGTVLSATPDQGPPLSAYVPTYDSGPRIIHVPQPGDRVAVAPPQQAVTIDEDDVVEERQPLLRRLPPRPAPAAPKEPTSHKESVAPRKPATPPKPRRELSKAETPAPIDRRAVLTAPSEPSAALPDTSLTPIRPTPRFGTTAAQNAGRITAAPPPGYTPPRNIPLTRPSPPEPDAETATPDASAPSGEPAPANDTP